MRRRDSCHFAFTKYVQRPAGGDRISIGYPMLPIALIYRLEIFAGVNSLKHFRCKFKTLAISPTVSEFEAVALYGAA